MQKLKLFREGHMQSLAKAVFDFSMDDKVRYKLLFETEGNLKLMWQFIFLSFMDQELLMLELKYKQHSEDFSRINNYQIEHGLIAKKDGPKVYRLFELFCLKDKVFNAFINRQKQPLPSQKKENVVENLSTSAMEVDSGLKLPAYSEVENMMDDTNIKLVDFMSRFEKFRVDEVSIDDAEDDICFNAKDAFEECTNVCLFGLRFPEDKTQMNGKRGK